VIVELQQNQRRYFKEDNGYKISAKEGLTPVTIQVLEDDLDIEGVLPFDIKGVIIYLRNYNRYLASSELLETLADSVSINPHYTYKEHSKVLGARMGKTIPIIPIDTLKILEEIEKQKGKIPFSGVKDVEWEINGNDTSVLIKQIIWTLSPNAEKPLDTYKVFDLNLSADYSIDAIPVEPLDKDARVPEDKLANNIKIINDRLAQLNSDFQSIKDIFYFGKITPTSTTKYTILASADSGDDISVQVVSKSSTAVDKQPLVSTSQSDAAQAKADELAQKVEQAQTDLQKKIDQTENTIKTAQAGDTAAQSELRRQLLQAQQNLTNTNASLLSRLKAKGIDI
jgi:hypothetical protein